MFKNWLIIFLTEKGIVKDIEDSLGKEFEENGFIGFTHETFFDYLQSSESWLRSRIKDTFVQIDFKNGDVTDYYNHIKAAYLAALKVEFSDFVQ